MNKNLIFKEWKEKLWIPIFALVFLALFAVAAGVFAKRGDILDYLTGGIQIFFLPLIGVLLGASAFSAEFKDSTWAYLFSRPIKKSSIWLSKFAALAGLLAAIVAVTYIVLPLIPGFKERLAEAPLWGLSLFISFSVYVVSFSLSLLSEKPVLTFFLTLFIFAAFAVLPVLLIKTLVPFAFKSRSLQDVPFLVIIFAFLGVLALGAASLSAFCRTDFSSPKSKISGFLKSLVVFLAIGTVTGGAGWLIARQFPRPTFIRMISDGEGSILHLNRGVFRYDSQRNRLEKLIRFQRQYWLASPAVGGGKITWAKESVKGSRQGLTLDQELWIMDIDGRNKRAIFHTSNKPDSPLAGDMIYHLSVSPDGKRLILGSYPGSRSGQKRICSLNTDGTGLRFYSTDLTYLDWINGLCWSSDSRRIVFAATIRPSERASNKQKIRYFLLDLEAGEWTMPPEDLRGFSIFGASRDGKLLGYFGTDTADAASPKEMLRYYNIDTNAISDIVAVSRIQSVNWSPAGDRIAFLADSGRRLGIISVSEKTLLAETALEKAEIEARTPRSMAWTLDGQKIILADFRNSVHVLRIFDQALREIKSFPIPREDIPLEHLPHLYSTGDKILVMDFTASRLWSFDPATEKWKKLF